MSDRDLVDLLLSGQRVPAISAGFGDRVVAEAQRPDRARTAAVPRRRVRRWTRRSVWTAAIALNLVLASAVAAAIGGANFVPASLVAATQRVLENIRPHIPLLRDHRTGHMVANHHPAPAVASRIRYRPGALPPRVLPPHFERRIRFAPPPPARNWPARRFGRAHHDPRPRWAVRMHSPQRGAHRGPLSHVARQGRYGISRHAGLGVDGVRHLREPFVPRWRGPGWRGGFRATWVRGGWRGGSRPFSPRGPRGRRW